MRSDTPPDVDEQLDALLGQRSGSDRVRMISDMFDTARALVIADIKGVHPLATDVEVAVGLFERLYGDDFDADERARLRARLVTVAEKRRPH